MQHETNAWWHEPGSEAAIVALDEGNDIAVPIDYRKIDRVAAFGVGNGAKFRRRHDACRLLGVDELGALGRVRFVEHVGYWDLGEARVSYVMKHVGIS